MSTISICTELAAPADIAWQAIKTPHVFVHVARGMLRYPAAERLDRPWRVGDDLVGWTFLFGVVPVSSHHLTVSSIDEDAYMLITDEHGGLVRTWHHELLVTPIGVASCMYEDRIEIDAGPFTPVVTAFASVFFRHRQRRLRRLVHLLAAMSD